MFYITLAIVCLSASLYLSLLLPLYISVCLSDCLHCWCLLVNQSICLPHCLPVCLRVYVYHSLFKRVDVCKSTWQFIYSDFSFPPYYISVCMSVYTCLFICFSISPCLHVCISTSLSVRLSTCMSTRQPVRLSVEQYVWAAFSLPLAINTEGSVLWLSPRPGNKAPTSNTHERFAGEVRFLYPQVTLSVEQTERVASGFVERGYV